MKSENTERLKMIRRLNQKSGAGLLFCYKALKAFHYDKQRAFQIIQKAVGKGRKS